MSKSPWSWPGSLVTAVIDGDTITAQVSRDLGFGGVASFEVRLRLNRINAPKASTDSGKSATSFVVGAVKPNAQLLLIETVSSYKYGGPDTSPGEWMAEVTLPDGSNLSDELVNAGLAVYWDGQGPRPSDG